MFTKSDINKLINRMRQTPEELLNSRSNPKRLSYNLRCKEGATILGVAHCDYVRSAWAYPTLTADGSKLIGGQVDDRVGVWLLLDILPGLIPSFDVLLTDDEEVGRSTAQEVDPDSVRYNWTFQFDRRGVDFVDYGKASKSFIRKFKRTTGITHGVGSFSDICYLPDSCGSKVNIGTGYYDEHTPGAFVDLAQCFDQVQRFARFANKFAEKAFKAPVDKWADWNDTWLDKYDPFPSVGVSRRNRKKLPSLTAAQDALTGKAVKLHRCQWCEEVADCLTYDGICDNCHFKLTGEESPRAVYDETTRVS